jgi:hypothetical protein
MLKKSKLVLLRAHRQSICPNHALLTQKFLQKKRLLILDTPEHVDPEKLNRQIDLVPPSTKIQNMWLKLAKID